MLKDASAFSKLVICPGKVDLRKGIDGLAAFVRVRYNLNPAEKGTLFLFKGNRSDRIKGICFEGLGMTMYTFRLNHGNRFQWPRDQNEALCLTPEQYTQLMAGFPLKGTIRESYPAVDNDL